MAHNNWEADKMLDVYIHDYLVRRNLHASAKSFMTEAKVSMPIAIDVPGGFLFEWWSVFWDIFFARTNKKHSDVAVAYIEAQQMKAREEQRQHAQMQQLQVIQQRRAQMHREGSHPSLNKPFYGMNRENVLSQSPASLLPAKMYGEQLKQKHPLARDLEFPAQLLDAGRLALLKSNSCQSCQLVQSTPGNVSMALQQVHARSQQPSDNGIDMLSRSVSMDPTLYGLPGAMQSRFGLCDAGLNQGVIPPPLKGWPLTVSQNQLQQLQLLTPQQRQQLLAHGLAQEPGNTISPLTVNCADTDPRRSWVLRSGLGVRDGQPTGSYDSQHVDSPIQMAPPLVRPASKDRPDLLMKQPAKYQEHVQLQQQQLLQNTRKRKQPSQSGPANSTATGITANPVLNFPPSTTSIHSPGDERSIASALPHSGSMSKNLMMYGSDGGTCGLASTSEHLDDLEIFGDVGSSDDNVESFLSHDDRGTKNALFGTVKRSSSEHKTVVKNGFSFSEVACLRSSNDKVVCCHFSSDGKLLASAGHDKKVDLWNMDTLDCQSSLEEHSLFITDVRFRPNSAYMATSSFDKTVRIWNADVPSYSLFKLAGHRTHVMSLDFHPKKVDLLCSCDDNAEIRLWNINQQACTRISKQAGNAQVRFQPRVGLFLAAAAENVISIIDVETDQPHLSLKGHNKEILSMCWDSSGGYLATVSEDSVRVWSMASGGKCLHQLNSSGNKFHSSVFHPSYSLLLVIGGHQLLELWNPLEDKSMTVPAHGGLVAALANSPGAGMVASASHDKCVKLWK